MKKILIILLFILHEFHSFADDKIFLAVTSPWPPFEYTENEENVGTDVEIIKQAFKRMNKKIIIMSFRWKTCLEMIKNNKADAIFSLRKTKQRENFLIFPDEVLNKSENVFFKKKENDHKYSGKLIDLKGLTIGVTKGYDYGNEFMNSKLFKLNYSNRDITGFKKVDRGTVDLFICDKLVGLFQLKKNKIRKIDFIPFIYSKFDMYLAFAKKKNYNIIVKEFEKALKSLKEDQTYNKILNKYTGAY